MLDLIPLIFSAIKGHTVVRIDGEQLAFHTYFLGLSHLIGKSMSGFTSAENRWKMFYINKTKERSSEAKNLTNYRFSLSSFECIWQM